jgi:hypothetical protein
MRAGRVVKKGGIPAGCILVAIRVVKERFSSHGSVPTVISAIAEEGTRADRRVAAADRVAKERSVSNGGVGTTFGVIKESERPVGEVCVACVVTQKRSSASAVFSRAVLRSSVPAPIAVLKLPSVRLRSEKIPTAVL